MSVVIIGGNECMVRQYKDLCQSYQCNAKVFAKNKGSLHNKVGNPDLMVLFTGTMSHRMVRCALSETKGSDCCKISHQFHCRTAEYFGTVYERGERLQE